MTSPTAARSRLAIGLVALLVALTMLVLATDRPRSQTDGVKNVVTVPRGATSVDPQSGREWRAVAGTWVIYGGRLALDRPDAQSSVLVTNADSSNYTVTAAMVVVAQGVGLVFRYSDTSNYWAITEVPDVQTWRIVRVLHGTATELTNTGPGTCCLADTHVSVSTGRDGTVAVSLNDVLARTLVDLALVGERGTGDIATGSDARNAVVTDLEVRQRSLQ